MSVLPSNGLFDALRERSETGRPVRVALVGCGKFGTMFLAQARRLPGLDVTVAVDLDLDRARDAFGRAGWPPSATAASTPSEAIAAGSTYLATSLDVALELEEIDVVVEATGHARAGARHALAAIDAGKDLVMVNVEADVLVGPELARRAAQQGTYCSMAYGDQPALICELVDWARSCGFEVVCAGKGTKYLPAYHAVGPDKVWEHYGFDRREVETGDYNAKMFTSFLDGTKSGIEMVAVSNATGLLPPTGGLAFPPAGVPDLPTVCRPTADGGWLERTPTVEVVSSLNRDGGPVDRDLRWGVYVTFTAEDDYTRRCLAEYGGVLDAEGQYAALYRPNHYIGLELPVSVLSVALRREPTGMTRDFRADVAAVAKRDLAPGFTLDGEGGYAVWGRAEPAHVSVAAGHVPIGLADGLRVIAPVAAGDALTWDAVSPLDEADEVVKLRRATEAIVSNVA
jgi:predicted homoserine dehydrogenase-like protein